jgi:hypothetical protein
MIFDEDLMRLASRLMAAALAFPQMGEGWQDARPTRGELAPKPTNPLSGERQPSQPESKNRYKCWSRQAPIRWHREVNSCPTACHPNARRRSDITKLSDRVPFQKIFDFDGRWINQDFHSCRFG